MPEIRVTFKKKSSDLHGREKNCQTLCTICWKRLSFKPLSVIRRWEHCYEKVSSSPKLVFPLKDITSGIRSARLLLDSHQYALTFAIPDIHDDKAISSNECKCACLSFHTIAWDCSKVNSNLNRAWKLDETVINRGCNSRSIVQNMHVFAIWIRRWGPHSI